MQVNSATAAAFIRLSRLVYAGGTFEDIYRAICSTARSVIPACDHAGVTTMKAGEEPYCEAATGSTARLIDQFERETGEGPCLDAIVTARYDGSADISRDPVWPTLAKRVLESTSVRGMMGYRLLVGDRKAGALNIYSDTPGALGAEAASLGALVAAYASVTVTAAVRREDAANMREAILTNREIGKATGILAVTHDISTDEAFERLRSISNQFNIRMAHLAEQMVARHGRSE